MKAHAKNEKTINLTSFKKNLLALLKIDLLGIFYFSFMPVIVEFKPS